MDRSNLRNSCSKSTRDLVEARHLTSPSGGPTRQLFVHNRPPLESGDSMRRRPLRIHRGVRHSRDWLTEAREFLGDNGLGGAHQGFNLYFKLV